MILEHQISTGFRKLTGCQRDPRDRGVTSPLGTRVRIDQICQDCDLEILGILLIVDLRVMNT